MAKLIAQTYGQALYELAVEENKVDELLEEVKSLKAAFTDGDEFSRFMKNPQVTKEEKAGVIEGSLKGKVSEDMVGFLLAVVSKDRFGEIVAIFDYFIGAVKEQKGIGQAFVSTPSPLSDAQKEAVVARLLETSGYKEMEMEYEVDPSLIGGIVIRIGDRIVDSSIKTRLYELTKELQKVQV